MSVPPVFLSQKSSQPFSAMAYGVWHTHEMPGTQPNALLDLIHYCIGQGITTFDHADIYGNYECERLFGRALAKAPSLRGQMQLVSKCGIKLLSTAKPSHRVKHYDSSFDHIIHSAENSLQNLGTDHLDLLLIHRPDPLMQAEEVARAFNTLQTQGKVLAFGVSNFSASQFNLLQKACGSLPLVTNQIEISLKAHSPLTNGLLDHAQTVGYRPMAWSPLGGGGLLHGNGPLQQRVSAVLNTLLPKYNLTPEQASTLLFAWLLKHPAGIVPVLGTTKTARIGQAAQAFGVDLDLQDWYLLYEAALGQEVP